MTGINEKIEQFLRSLESQFIHIDELVSLNIPIAKTDLWEKSLKIFDEIVNNVKKREIKSAQVNLLFELISDRNEIISAPDTLNTLVESIDEYSMPEIIISNPKKDFWQPKLEIYACPIFFRIEGIGDDVHVLYEEYRSIAEKQEGLEFNRWLTFSYLKSP